MNARDTIKTIYSSPLLLFKAVRKIRFNSFVGGLLIGALFSLFINLVTVQFQEVILRQKYLESLEREIFSHLSQASTFTPPDDTDIESVAFMHLQRYDSSVWNSGNTLGYLYSLPLNVQSSIETYYRVIILGANRERDSAQSLFNNLYYKSIECPVTHEIEHCEQYANAIQFATDQAISLRLSESQAVMERSSELLDNFHPSQDRVDSFILRTFMGNEIYKSLER